MSSSSETTTNSAPQRKAKCEWMDTGHGKGHKNGSFREHEIAFKKAAEFSCSVALNLKMFWPKILKQKL